MHLKVYKMLLIASRDRNYKRVYHVFIYVFKAHQELTLRHLRSQNWRLKAILYNISEVVFQIRYYTIRLLLKCCGAFNIQVLRALIYTRTENLFKDIFMIIFGHVYFITGHQFIYVTNRNLYYYFIIFI